MGNAASNYAKGAMALLPQEIPATSTAVRVDGGALRSFPLDPECEQLEVVLNTDDKQLNARIELLNAPNNPKQTFEVFTNNVSSTRCACASTRSTRETRFASSTWPPSSSRATSTSTSCRISFTSSDSPEQGYRLTPLACRYSLG